MRRHLVTVAVALVALGGCSSDSKVGSDDLLSFEERESRRLGGIDRSATPTATAKASTPRASARPTATRATTATARPATKAPTVPTVTIEITADAYKPFTVRVFQGTKVVWVNRDAQPRTSTEDNGVWDSKAIAPGRSWTWVAARTGTFNYHDDTRPFVVGQLEVVPR